jgi:type IV fimbrial biogenesis protein FimT
MNLVIHTGDPPSAATGGHPGRVALRQPCRCDRIRGFTLIELMVVVALVAILVSLAAPSFQDFLIRNRSAAMANDFVGSVLRARNEAVSRNTCVVMCRSTFANNPPQCAAGTDWQPGWVVFVDNTCSAPNVAANADDVIMTTGPLRPEYSLVATGANTDRIMFASTGYARPGDAQGFDLRYQTSTRPSNRRICLSVMGRTRVTTYGTAC